MQYEEFENKIRYLWNKPIEQLENPEFIKYCDKFFEDETFLDSHFGESNLLNEYIYFKHQINLNKFHEQYMKEPRNFDFDIENEIVLFLYDNEAFFESNKCVMLITNKNIYYLLPERKKGKLLLEHMDGKVVVTGRSNYKININGLILGKIDIFDGAFSWMRLIPFLQPEGKKLLQKFFDGIYSNRSLFFPNAKEQGTFVNQFDEKSVQSKRSFNMRYIIFIFIVIYIGLFFWLSNDVEETVVNILKENNVNVNVDSVSIPYSSPISQNYFAIVRLSNQNKIEVVDFRVRGHFWSGITVSVSGEEMFKIISLTGKSILGE